ncbi:MAG: pyrroline-5-carboxylate reductase [Gammaproteobacteria bacterium]|nr:MAG: pyrroline-5-carboxylate reductase [Gammaproteobacteria bacterium]
MKNNRVGFIGGGNMTRAIAGGLLASGFSASEIAIADPSAKQRAHLADELPDTLITESNHSVAEQVGCLVLATKPQVLANVCRDLAATVQANRPLIVSIAAGVRSSDIDSWLGGGLAVVRAMPNQPALLRLGVSALYANEQASAGDRELAATIMGSVGKVVTVPTEADIDVATAISGSGPAYFYLLIDMLVKTAKTLGLDEAAAFALATETAVGAAALAVNSDETMDELIARVRSPGGTTAAALDCLEQQDVRDIFATALTAARDKATQLADEAGQ